MPDVEQPGYVAKGAASNSFARSNSGFQSNSNGESVDTQPFVVPGLVAAAGRTLREVIKGLGRSGMQRLQEEASLFQAKMNPKLADEVLHSAELYGFSPAEMAAAVLLEQQASSKFARLSVEDKYTLVHDMLISDRLARVKFLTEAVERIPRNSTNPRDLELQQEYQKLQTEVPLFKERLPSITKIARTPGKAWPKQYASAPWAKMAQKAKAVANRETNANAKKIIMDALLSERAIKEFENKARKERENSGAAEPANNTARRAARLAVLERAAKSVENRRAISASGKLERYGLTRRDVDRVIRQVGMNPKNARSRLYATTLLVNQKKKEEQNLKRELNGPSLRNLGLDNSATPRNRMWALRKRKLDQTRIRNTMFSATQPQASNNRKNNRQNSRQNNRQNNGKNVRPTAPPRQANNSAMNDLALEHSQEGQGMREILDPSKGWISFNRSNGRKPNANNSVAVPQSNGRKPNVVSSAPSNSKTQKAVRRTLFNRLGNKNNANNNNANNANNNYNARQGERFALGNTIGAQNAWHNEDLDKLKREYRRYTSKVGQFFDANQSTQLALGTASQIPKLRLKTYIRLQRWVFEQYRFDQLCKSDADHDWAFLRVADSLKARVHQTYVEFVNSDNYGNGASNSRRHITLRGREPGSKNVWRAVWGANNLPMYMRFIRADGEQELLRAHQMSRLVLCRGFPHFPILYGAARITNKGTPYYLAFTEAFNGNLAQWLRQKGRSPREIGGALVQVLMALAVLHGRKIAHAALTPANIVYLNTTLADAGWWQYRIGNRDVYVRKSGSMFALNNMNHSTALGTENTRSQPHCEVVTVLKMFAGGRGDVKRNAMLKALIEHARRTRPDAAMFLWNTAVTRLLENYCDAVQTTAKTTGKLDKFDVLPAGYKPYRARGECKVQPQGSYSLGSGSGRDVFGLARIGKLFDWRS